MSGILSRIVKGEYSVSFFCNFPGPRSNCPARKAQTILAIASVGLRGGLRCCCRGVKGLEELRSGVSIQTGKTCKRVIPQMQEDQLTSSESCSCRQCATCAVYGVASSGGTRVPDFHNRMEGLGPEFESIYLGLQRTCMTEGLRDLSQSLTVVRNRNR